MYNLLVSANNEDWKGDSWTIELNRCVNEYTDAAIKKKYGKLEGDALVELLRLPCIFAYEAFHKLAPKFGLIREVTKRKDVVRLEYEIQKCEPFLSATSLAEMKFELDVSEWELNRTHWAVKDVNLAKELKPKGILLPQWAAEGSHQTVDITEHQFDVALSFPGEVRGVVSEIVGHLEGIIGPHTYFYDNNYVAQLARPALDTLLQDIYKSRAKLVVVFLSANYQEKTWCGIEFRAIRDIIAARDHKRVMFVRTDDGNVEGVFKTDGYVDARKFGPREIAHFIQERLQVLK